MMEQYRAVVLFTPYRGIPMVDVRTFVARVQQCRLTLDVWRNEHTGEYEIEFAGEHYHGSDMDDVILDVVVENATDYYGGTHAVSQ